MLQRRKLLKDSWGTVLLLLLLFLMDENEGTDVIAV